MNRCLTVEFCFLWLSARFSFATDIARGMSHLHQHKICHGRLKSPNCVLDDRWVCKITGLLSMCSNGLFWGLVRDLKRIPDEPPKDATQSNSFHLMFVSPLRLWAEVISQGRQDRASVLLSAEAHWGVHATWVSELQCGAHTGWRRVLVLQ